MAGNKGLPSYQPGDTDVPYLCFVASSGAEQTHCGRRLGAVREYSLDTGAARSGDNGSCVRAIKGPRAASDLAFALELQKNALMSQEEF